MYGDAIGEAEVSILLISMDGAKGKGSSIKIKLWFG